MAFTDISTAISQLGFPIVMCLGLFYYIIKDAKATREEVAKLSKALDNNTKVISQFLAMCMKERNDEEWAAHIFSIVN